MSKSDTPTALLDAAEGAFARDGIGEASLRAIMRDAGANPAAIHYHFGSREDLARAVLDRTLAPLNQRRLALLDTAVARLGAGEVPLEVLLDAIVRPDFEAAVALYERDARRVRLIGAIYVQPTMFVKAIVESYFAPVARTFMVEMQAALPGVDAAELSWRVRWCVFGLLGALFSDDDFDPDVEDIEVSIRRVVTVTAGALRAPELIGEST